MENIGKKVWEIGNGVPMVQETFELMKEGSEKNIGREDWNILDIKEVHGRVYFELGELQNSRFTWVPLHVMYVYCRRSAGICGFSDEY